VTRQAAGFIAGALALYVVGSYSQIGWFFLFDAVLWALVVISAVAPRWSLAPLTVTRQVRHRPAIHRNFLSVGPCEGDPVEVRITVANSGRLPRYLIRVREESPLDDPAQGPRRFFVAVIPARGEVTLGYTANCYKRGHYTEAAAVLETGAPFGVFNARRQFSLPLPLTVYPAFYPLEALPETGQGTGNGTGLQVTAPTHEPYGSREHQWGEPLRYVHWRNTARRGQFMVRQFEQPEQVALRVALAARQAWGQGKETTLEYGVKIGASLVMKGAEVGESVTLLLGPDARPQASWREAMDELAGLEPTGAAAMDALEGRGAPIGVVVVPAREPEHLPGMLRLAQLQQRLVVVLLEGFASGEEPERFAAALRASNVTVVRCARGHLREAVEALGHPSLYESHQRG